ncbi:MAG: hypothetical protein EG825_03100 [Rhodocyclaceae bacterium]|nr:hypothetical protein [Rhodocyclaceae bacterium]
MRAAVAIQDRPLNWKQKTWRFIKGTLILLVLAIFMIWSIFFIAKFIRNIGGSRGPNVITLSSEPPPTARNARTTKPPVGGDWGLTSPALRPSTPAAANGGRGGNGRPAEPSVPVGIPEEEYRAVVAAGGKVYIPNPQGECDLAGPSAADSVRALESCIAQRAAR